MIKLKCVKKNQDGMNNQFVIRADEPVTIEFMENANGHTIAHVYRGVNTDEHSEPVGAYDSEVEPTDWLIEAVGESNTDA